MIYDQDNIFAKIIRRELPAKIIYEDEQVIAIEDIKPIAPVHILILPKNAYIDYEDFILKASNDEIIHYFKTIPKIAAELNLNQNSYRLMTNKGSASGQIIFHFHTHLLSGTF